MSDYNADPNPDLDLIRQVGFGFTFVEQADVKTDQFSTGSSLKVYHFAKKIGSTRLQFLVDPTEIPI